MKKAMIAVVCFLTLLLLCGCNPKEQDDMGIKTNNTGKTVTFVNGVSDASVWILPDTEANRKTTLWGSATVSRIASGESCKAPLCEPGDEGLYQLRMIGTDKYYYSAYDIVLEDGWTMEIREEEFQYFLDVSDQNGELQSTYEVFAARL